MSHNQRKDVAAISIKEEESGTVWATRLAKKKAVSCSYYPKIDCKTKNSMDISTSKKRSKMKPIKIVSHMRCRTLELIKESDEN